MTDSSTLAAVRAVFFDMDGVIYVGQRLLPGVQEFLDYLTASGRRYLFVTNNATMTAVQFAAKLARLGLTVAPEHILGSAEATAAWLTNQVHLGWKPGKVIVMGQAGLRDALRAAGFELTDDPFAATYAVAGAHFEVTYRELADAALAIRNGACFIGTNTDRTFPSERGLIPGAGSMLALLEAATDVQPTVIGKPNPPMFEIALARVGLRPDQVMMVGDRYDTDIAGAIELGMLTAAVLTGVHDRAVFAAASPPPHMIVEGLPELLAVFRDERG